MKWKLIIPDSLIQHPNLAGNPSTSYLLRPVGSTNYEGVAFLSRIRSTFSISAADLCQISKEL